MKKKEEPRPYKANYQNATAKEVARAILRHRPKAKQDRSKILIDVLDGDQTISPCSDPVTDVSRLQLASSSASPYLSDIACIPHASEDSDEESDPET